MVGLPLIGGVKGDTAQWKLPISGSKFQSTVRLAEGGKHLYGKTTIQKGAEESSYTWQAELIEGKPIDFRGQL
jgi:hypothetical protein